MNASIGHSNLNVVNRDSSTKDLWKPWVDYDKNCDDGVSPSHSKACQFQEFSPGEAAKKTKQENVAKITSLDSVTAHVSSESTVHDENASTVSSAHPESGHDDLRQLSDSQQPSSNTTHHAPGECDKEHSSNLGIQREISMDKGIIPMESRKRSVESEDEVEKKKFQHFDTGERIMDQLREEEGFSAELQNSPRADTVERKQGNGNEIICIDSSDEDENTFDTINISSGDDSSDSENVETYNITMKKGNARYIAEKTREFSAEFCARKKITLTLSSGGFKIRGTQRAVKWAHKDITVMSNNLHEHPHSVNIPGIKDHFQSPEGLLFLKNTERIYNCVIMTKADGPESIVDLTPSATATYSRPNLSLVTGDITCQQADVIVNPMHPQCVSNIAGGPAIARAIAAQAGPDLQSQLLKFSSSCEIGSVFETEGGLLPYKIYHVMVDMYVPEKSKGIIQHVIWNSLYQADNAGLSSIAFPAIATGGYRHPVDLIAKWMKEIINCFTARTLQDIIIVLHPMDQSVIQYFTSEFGIQCQQQTTSHVPSNGRLSLLPDSAKPSCQPLLAKACTQAPAASGTSPTNDGRDLQRQRSMVLSQPIETYNFLLCSNKKEDIHKVIQVIDLEISKITQTQEIEDEVFQRFTEWEVSELLEMKQRFRIDISYNQWTHKICLRGLRMNVQRAQDEVKTMLKEFSIGETCSSYVTWEMMVSYNSWEEFPIRAVYKLENAYKSCAKSPDDPRWKSVTVRYLRSGMAVKLDLDITTVDCDTNQQRPPYVRRRKREQTEEELPKHWNPMSPSDEFAKIELDLNSPEARGVIEKFSASNPSFQSIIKIERIQNPFLYKQYKVRKDAVESNAPPGSTVTRELFHGTAQFKVDKICAAGFDRNFAGENGAAFGKGVYFAVNSSYSVRYAKSNPSCIFLVDVITGDYTQGRPCLRAPPEKFNSQLLYDSVVDNVSFPSIFVVFRDSSTYPLYLITFQTSHWCFS